ncbi:hypothetical protein BMW23_0862 [Bodo saltans virus]|uniref:Transmembrane protein n=1 Tax=Bodo saltans virus TaxID=2024608 RepID=A0A2H4UVL2_9VIRU|nr:hypothetical protein QJ851_gp0844 [Bodo saltans virus]ATZ80907.1 hypothetical protein BMW23_0862 [Bodo saltans virus]
MELSITYTVIPVKNITNIEITEETIECIHRGFFYDSSPFPMTYWCVSVTSGNRKYFYDFLSKIEAEIMAVKIKNSDDIGIQQPSKPILNFSKYSNRQMNIYKCIFGCLTIATAVCYFADDKKK